MTNETNIKYNLDLPFRKTKYLWRDMNKTNRFSLDGMDGEGSNAYKIMLCSNLPENIYDIVDVNHCIKNVDEVTGFSKIETIEEPDIYLQCTDLLSDGGFVIDVTNVGGIQLEFGDSNDIKLAGALLYNLETKYLLAYCKISSAVTIRNFVTIPFYTSLISVGNTSD